MDVWDWDSSTKRAHLEYFQRADSRQMEDGDWKKQLMVVYNFGNQSDAVQQSSDSNVRIVHYDDESIPSRLLPPCTSFDASLNVETKTHNTALPWDNVPKRNENNKKMNKLMSNKNSGNDDDDDDAILIAIARRVREQHVANHTLKLFTLDRALGDENNTWFKLEQHLVGDKQHDHVFVKSRSRHMISRGLSAYESMLDGPFDKMLHNLLRGMHRVMSFGLLVELLTRSVLILSAIEPYNPLVFDYIFETTSVYCVNNSAGNPGMDLLLHLRHMFRELCETEKVSTMSKRLLQHLLIKPITSSFIKAYLQAVFSELLLEKQKELWRFFQSCTFIQEMNIRHDSEFLGAINRVENLTLLIISAVGELVSTIGLMEQPELEKYVSELLFLLVTVKQDVQLAERVYKWMRVHGDRSTVVYAVMDTLNRPALESSLAYFGQITLEKVVAQPVYSKGGKLRFDFKTTVHALNTTNAEVPVSRPIKQPAKF